MEGIHSEADALWWDANLRTASVAVAAFECVLVLCFASYPGSLTRRIYPLCSYLQTLPFEFRMAADAWRTKRMS